MQAAWARTPISSSKTWFRLLQHLGMDIKLTEYTILRIYNMYDVVGPVY
jgi:hypothetical protein